MHSSNLTPFKNYGSGIPMDIAFNTLPLWSQVYRMVHSKNFTDLLVEKFLLPNGEGIPLWKRELLVDKEHNRMKNFQTSAMMRMEPAEYHQYPHVDYSLKVVTWQYFYPVDYAMQRMQTGTKFYTPRRRLQMNDQMNPYWLSDVDYMKEVKEFEVIPNHFFSFAPSNISFHGAHIVPKQVIDEIGQVHHRRTFLGIVVSEDRKFSHFGMNGKKVSLLIDQ